MALFKRADLKAKGMTDEQIDFVLTEASRALSNDYVLKSDSDAAIQKAVEENKSDPTQSEEYINMQGKLAKMEAFQGDEFKDVKNPYKDIVWDKLDHEENHKPYAEQIASLRDSMPDLFTAKEEEPAKTPQFGAPTGGLEMPKGKETPSFGDAWGYSKR